MLADLYKVMDAELKAAKEKDYSKEELHALFMTCIEKYYKDIKG